MHGIVGKEVLDCNSVRNALETLARISKVFAMHLDHFHLEDHT